MPPRSPLPPRHGLSAAWLRTPDPDSTRPDATPWRTMAQWLHHRLPEHVDVDAMLAEGRFVAEDGSPVRPEDPFRPRLFVFFHRDLREEPEVPGTIHVVHRDDRLVVVDKPPFLSSIPRGRHVMQSVVVRLRAELGLPELSPLHRLDRVTSGLLMLATEQRWRGPYQTAFERRAMEKTYWALAPVRPELDFPMTVRNHLRKERGQWQVQVVPGAPVNAETLIELESELDGHGVYRLSPRTGQTHQLRMHLNGLGIPIVNDPLYPVVREVDVDDFSAPLQLLAGELRFIDPVDGTEREFRSVRRLPLTLD
ncbi:pseudouridine synthase [Cellulomonas sp. NPDC089187]|uniref:pseudouridine synthase n=1 Tax=Cellulomonas sp. NPDC089187 TaxID=3154970 RepID=UPI00341690C0